jgi:hypothetical protein
MKIEEREPIEYDPKKAPTLKRRSRKGKKLSAPKQDNHDNQ